MTFRQVLINYTPVSIKRFLRQFIKAKPTKARRESNLQLRIYSSDIGGDVLSIGSGKDEDGEGGKYRDYFANCTSYTTSEISAEFKCDMVLDIRSMPEVRDESFDCIFCSGVLEHVDNYPAALEEMTRILKSGGVLLLGLPFRQGLHLEPHDYWRFTKYAIRYMLHNDYKILDLAAIDNPAMNFPATYWVKAKKLNKIGKKG